MPYKDYSHYLYKLKLTEGMTSGSCSVMHADIKKWKEASSFSSTPKHLSIWQDVAGNGQVKEEIKDDRRHLYISSFSLPNYFTLLHLLFYIFFISLTAKVLQYSLSHQHTTLTPRYKSVSPDSCLALFLLD